ncbi:hypothetical protein BX666DRAFT_129491 [Dichotomocladium elegans]|nr:hypothetical protein BX666DRAFT_129491 [Dichotomocladium elegans]
MTTVSSTLKPAHAPRTLAISPYDPMLDVPTTGRCIVGQFDEDTIVVYQAFSPSIAVEAVKYQQLSGCNGFKMDRMTWIKTSFAWMQYRSGWNTKPKQERTLAIRIRRSIFDELVSNAKSGLHGSALERKSHCVRIQWDPDYRPYVSTERLGERRAIQLGLRGRALAIYASTESIVSIEDITEFVIEMRERDPSDPLWVPIQRIYDHPLFPASGTAGSK